MVESSIRDYILEQVDKDNTINYQLRDDDICEQIYSKLKTFNI